MRKKITTTSSFSENNMNKHGINKKGFILIWALGLVVLISMVATNLINRQVDSNITFWKKSLLMEEAIYSHIMTLEGWAKSRIIKGRYSYLNPKKNKITSILKDPDLKISGSIEVQDGKFNLVLLEDMTKDQEWVIKYFFKRAFPDADVNIPLIVSKLKAGDILGAINQYGNYKDFVYYNPKPNNIGSDERSIFPNVYQINVNAMHMSTKGQMLISSGAHPSKTPIFWEQYFLVKRFENKSEIEDAFGQLLTPLFKTKSLFYDLKGNIIIGGYKREVLIKLERSGSDVKAVSRRIL